MFKIRITKINDIPKYLGCKFHSSSNNDTVYEIYDYNYIKKFYTIGYVGEKRKIINCSEKQLEEYFANETWIQIKED